MRKNTVAEALDVLQAMSNNELVEYSFNGEWWLHEDNSIMPSFQTHCYRVRPKKESKYIRVENLPAQCWLWKNKIRYLVIRVDIEFQTVSYFDPPYMVTKSTEWLYENGYTFSVGTIGKQDVLVG